MEGGQASGGIAYHRRKLADCFQNRIFEMWESIEKSLFFLCITEIVVPICPMSILCLGLGILFRKNPWVNVFEITAIELV